MDEQQEPVYVIDGRKVYWPFAAVEEEVPAGAVENMAGSFARVFSTTSGKLVLSQILNWAGLDKGALAPGEADTTAYNLGRQEVGRKIVQKIKEGING